MPTPQPTTLSSTPGIKRDSTQFEGDNYIDGQWCRFSARGLPRKISGYASVTSQLPEIVRGMDSFVQDATIYIHLGSQSALTQIQAGLSGVLGLQSARTPSGFVPNAANLWQITTYYNKVGGASYVIAHPGRNLVDIASSVETPIYYGPITGTGLLTATGLNGVSGGVLPVPPYLFAFSNSGRVDISAINDLTVPAVNSTFVTAQKIVRGLPLRSQTPSALLWSLDTLVSAVFDVGQTSQSGLPTFDFSELAEISILSSQSVVEFDSIYYWPGVDRFYMFNGISQEMPNNMNVEFFFDNLNFTYRQKAFTFKVPEWGEIWFCAPLFGATECNHAVIFNRRLNTWYDTTLPDGGRSAAVFAKVFQRPFLADVDLTSTGYTLWEHETGLDKVLGSMATPILSYYRTHEISPVIGPQQVVDKAYRVAIVEPDFKQSGTMQCTVYGRANAKSVAQPSVEGPSSFPASATSAVDQIVRFKDNARLLSFQFSSNTPGGDYEAGRTLAHIEPTDGRITQ